MPATKILIDSPVFYPSIGGVETVVATLAEGFQQRGREVKVVCQTPATDDKTFPFPVIRHPAPQHRLQLVRWCDVCLQGCVSLKSLWPLAFTRKPLAVTHQTWYRRLEGGIGWQDRLKLQVARGATNIAPSRAIAAQLPAETTVIPNPYAEDVFYPRPEIKRDRDLIFVGRLVSDKGADLLLEALSRLQQRGLTPHLTIVGSGPENAKLQQQAQQLNLAASVTFAGLRVGEELAELLNAHRLLIVPSRWAEPFGIVALEGIACGCWVIGSQAGGLPEAIGPGGITFPNGDVAALAQRLEEFLAKPAASWSDAVRSHLQRHQTARIIDDYLTAIEAHLS